MNKTFKRIVCASSLIALCFATGCTSNDAARTTVNVERESKGSKYTTQTVRRGTLTLNETIRARYAAAVAETYGFGESGLYYSAFNAQVGDEVQAGDMLASLETEGINSEIAELEARGETLETEISRCEELIELYDSRMEGREESSLMREKRRGYETKMRDAENEIKITDVRLAELEKVREGRVIYSGIDGTVTFVRSVEAGETSVSGRKIITVTDLSACMFTAEMDHPEAVTIGETYTFDVSGKPYEAVAVTADEMGIEEEARNEQSTRTRMYFRLITPSVDLDSDAIGKLTFTVDSREDVLYIPVDCITTVNGESAVYVPDEYGLKSVRYIETGFSTGKYVEVVSGLTEDDEIITN